MANRPTKSDLITHISLARLDLGVVMEKCHDNMPTTKQALYEKLRELRIEQRTNPASKYVGR